MFITSIFDTPQALYAATRNLMQMAAEHAQDGPAAILVPGGNTPKPLFADIAANPFDIAPEFLLAYTDERHVSADHPDNNHALTREMIAALKLASRQVLRVETERSLEDAADAYDQAWADFLDRGGRIPLALLGLGTDGHTCSLFTLEQIRNCPKKRYAVAVERKQGHHRITVTPALLASAAHTVIFATGQDKAPMVDALTRDPNSVAAGLAAAQCPRVSLWYAPGN